MNTINIEKVQLSDLNRLQIICKQTFFDTYSKENTQEDMKEYLAQNFNIDKLSQELKSANAAFYFAKNKNDTIGYLKLNFENLQNELKNRVGVEIERIYVLKEQQGKSIGTILLNTAIKIAKEKKVNYIWLGVWEKNLKAIEFYKNNNFIVADTHLFKLGKDEQTDLIMKLKL